MVEVKRKPGETTRSLVRRFSRRLQQSGILSRAKDAQFYKPKESKRARKMRALRGEELKKKYKKLEKLGRLRK